MTINKFKLLLIVAAVFASIIGCKSRDEKARELHNQAITANREGRSEDATRLLEKIVKEYPSTQTAVEANQALSAREVILGATKETRRKVIDMALQLYRLDNGYYPSTDQGIRSLTIKPVTGDPPKRWRTGGYVENESILDAVVGYESDGTKYNFTIK